MAEPRTDFGWIAKKYQLRLLFESCTAPTNHAPLQNRSSEERMTARLAALTLIVVLAFAVKVVPAQSGASGATVTAAAVSGVIATAIAWVFEKVFAGWEPVKRDSVQLSFYAVLALILFLYIVIDTLFGRWFAGLGLGRQFSSAVVAACISLVALLPKIRLYDGVTLTGTVVAHVVAVVVLCGALTYMIAAVPVSLFTSLLALISSSTSSGG